jgi:hypothetical protein
MRKLLLVCLISVFPSLASAQDAGPIIAAQALDPQAQSDLRRVLVIGDQMAGGMGAGITRMAEGDTTIEVVNRFNESSGLSRPEIYDWVAAIPKMVENKNFTAAFILMGVNDRRDMRGPNKSLPFGSAEWAALYKQRIDAVIDALSQQHIKVYWMGEPPMGDSGLDADMQNLTTMEKERVAAKGGVFIDLRAPFLGPDGKYNERGPDDTGTDRRLRESDGITFFKMGNNRLGQIALAALKGDAPVSAPSPNVAAEPNTGVPAAQDGNAERDPIFAQQGVDGPLLAQGGGDLAVAVATDAAAREANKASSIGIGAAKGSNAEALFTTGLSAPAPAGRFDDFNAVGGN